MNKGELGDCIAKFVKDLYWRDVTYAEKKWIRPGPFLRSEIGKNWWGHIHSPRFLFKIWYRLLLLGYPFIYKKESGRRCLSYFNVEALRLFINEKVDKYYNFEKKIEPIINLYHKIGHLRKKS